MPDIRRSFALLIFGCVFLTVAATNTAAQEAPIEYAQHWRSGDERSWYARGTATAASAVGNSSPTSMQVTVRLDANPQSPRQLEWAYGNRSVWDVSHQPSDGNWETVSNAIQPQHFSDNPNGYLEVIVTVPLSNTVEVELQKPFVIYGTMVNGFIPSPPNTLTHSMFMVPGTVKWKTDASGTVVTCEVEFGEVEQARQLNGIGRIYIQRKSQRFPTVFLNCTSDQFVPVLSGASGIPGCCNTRCSVGPCKRMVLRCRRQGSHYCQ